MNPQSTPSPAYKRFADPICNSVQRCGFDVHVYFDQVRGCCSGDGGGGDVVSWLTACGTRTTPRRPSSRQSCGSGFEESVSRVESAKLVALTENIQSPNCVSTNYGIVSRPSRLHSPCTNQFPSLRTNRAAHSGNVRGQHFQSYSIRRIRSLVDHQPRTSVGPVASQHRGWFEGPHTESYVAWGRGPN